MRLSNRPGFVLAALFSAALSLGGCATSDTVREQPTLLAYWQGERSSADCPAGERCFAVRSTPRGFKKLVEEQRARGLELTRFDALRTPSGRFYAGAWEASAEPRVVKIGLTWKKFFKHHRRHTAQGLDLVHLEVFDDRRPRVAAIWRPAESADGPIAPSRVVCDLSWSQLGREDRRLQSEGYYLAEIEVYSHPRVPQIPWIAGIWRRGEVETDLIETAGCEIAPDPIRLKPAGSTTEPGAAPCELEEPDGAGEDEEEPREDLEVCPAFGEVVDRTAQGFQPVDFEPYRMYDEPRLAVLLHRRQGADWLMVPASPPAVACRHELLNRQSPPDDAVLGLLGFQLLDLNLLPPGRIQSGHGGTLGTPPPSSPPIPTHKGLIHDGGTSGPPDDGP